jgi:hypothetical protein
MIKNDNNNNNTFFFHNFICSELQLIQIVLAILILVEHEQEKPKQ